MTHAHPDPTHEPDQSAPIHAASGMPLAASSPIVTWAPPRSDSTLIADATTLFTTTFGGEPDGVWAAPGRVNVIGDHVDYAGGVSIPFALPHLTAVAARRRADDVVTIVSVPPNTTTLHASVSLSDVRPGYPTGWSGYVTGTLWARLQDPSRHRENAYAGHGLDLAIISDVPLGSGLSSSAALECSVALAAQELSTHDPLSGADYHRLIHAAIRAENDIVGASTGGLDQRSSLLATAGHALVIDFRTTTVNQVACDVESDGLAFLVADTNAPHSLSDGQYASRRGVIDAVTAHGGATTLLDLDDAIATATSWAHTADAPVLPDIARARVTHVLEETERTKRVHQALNAKKWDECGLLMSESHNSLRDLYDVSTPELDSARDAALDAGALGARMTGGGFGGSIIALVPADTVTEIAHKIHQRAVDNNMPTPTVLAVTPASGARRLA